MTRPELIEVMAEAMWRGEAVQLAALNRVRQQEVWWDQSGATAGPWRAAATAALSAMEQAGWTVAPRDPNAEMTGGARNLLNSASRSPALVEN